MDILKYDPECYRCRNEGWITNDSFKDLITCPICGGKRLTRIVKNLTYKAILNVFGVFYNLLEKVNWVSQDILDFNRLHNKSIKQRVAKKIVTDYASGYAVEVDRVVLALETLAGTEAQAYFELAQKSHFNAFETHQIDQDFAKAIYNLTNH